MIVWFNGALMDADEVRISPFDHGFLVGDGVFETLVARDGKPVAARRHWERLVRSCEALGLPCMSADEFREALAGVLRANGMEEARLRVTITSGEGPLGSDRGDAETTRLVVATPLKPWPPTEKLVTSPWPRLADGALAGVKSISYAENVRSLAYAKSKGCGEAVVLNSRGEICEGTGSNLFVVWEGKLCTPPLSSGCLAGTARAMVIEACRAGGLGVHEVDLAPSVLVDCEEAFVTSSTRDVHPVAEIDGRELAVAPGPVTEKARSLFRALVETEVD